MLGGFVNFMVERRLRRKYRSVVLIFKCSSQDDKSMQSQYEGLMLCPFIDFAKII